MNKNNEKEYQGIDYQFCSVKLLKIENCLVNVIRDNMPQLFKIYYWGISQGHVHNYYFFFFSVDCPKVEEKLVSGIGAWFYSDE